MSFAVKAIKSYKISKTLLFVVHFDQFLKQINLKDMSLTLYYNPISQPSRAVLALLAMGEIKYEGKVIDLNAQEQKSEAYLKINPLGTVPTLVHDDYTLSESNAILEYLCDAFPEKLSKLRGTGIKEKHRVSEFLSYYQGSYRPSLIALYRTMIGALYKNESCSRRALNEAQKKMTSAFDHIEAQLAKGRKYLTGDNLTIADLLIFFETTDAEVYKFDFSKWTHLQNWYNQMIELDAIKPIHTKTREILPAISQKISALRIDQDSNTDQVVQFYTHPVSQPCRSVWTLLKLGDVKFDQKRVDFFNGQCKKPQYLENVNPAGTIPVVKHGKLAIAESNAILTYLCDTFPNLKSYAGTTAEERAKVNEFACWYQAVYRPALLGLFRVKYGAIKKGESSVKAQQVTEAEQSMDNALDFVEGRLAQRGTPFLCGSSLTIADILLFHETSNIEFYEKDISKWGKVKVWYEKVLQNPVVKEVMEKTKEHIDNARQLLKKVKVEQ